MSKETKKMVGWPKIILMLLVGLVGSFYRTGKEYYSAETVETSAVVISCFTFVVFIVIVTFVVRRANKVEE